MFDNTLPTAVDGYSEVAEVVALSDDGDRSNRLHVNKHTTQYPNGVLTTDYEVTVIDAGNIETILLTVEQVVALLRAVTDDLLADTDAALVKSVMRLAAAA